MRSTTIFSAIVCAALGTSAVIEQSGSFALDAGTLAARALPSSEITWPQTWDFDDGDAPNADNLHEFDDEHMSVSRSLSKRWSLTPKGEVAMDKAIRGWQQRDYHARFNAWKARKARNEKDPKFALWHPTGDKPYINTVVWNWWEDVKHIMKKNNANPGRTGPLGSLNCPNGCNKRDVVYGADGEIMVPESQGVVGSDHEYDALGWGEKPGDVGTQKFAAADVTDALGRPLL